MHALWSCHRRCLGDAWRARNAQPLVIQPWAEEVDVEEACPINGYKDGPWKEEVNIAEVLGTKASPARHRGSSGGGSVGLLAKKAAGAGGPQGRETLDASCIIGTSAEGAGVVELDVRLLRGDGVQLLASVHATGAELRSRFSAVCGVPEETLLVVLTRHNRSQRLADADRPFARDRLGNSKSQPTHMELLRAGPNGSQLLSEDGELDAADLACVEGIIALVQISYTV